MTTKLIAPKGVTGCSFEGVEYAVGKKQAVEVPDEAVAALAAFGFVPAAESSPEPAPEAPAA